MLLEAGLRLEPFPILLCWDRPSTDFSRYLPISPGPAVASAPDPTGPDHRPGPGCTAVPFAGPVVGW